METQKQERVILTPPEWDAIVNYVSAIQTPFPLLELAAAAKRSMQNAKMGNFTINQTAPKDDTPDGQPPQTEKEVK